MYRWFIFLSLIAEIMSPITPVMGQKSGHQVVFQKKPAQDMIHNRLTKSGVVKRSPVRAKK